jgi:hypothetical protein
MRGSSESQTSKLAISVTSAPLANSIDPLIWVSISTSGAGPLLDIGPYYVAALVSLLTR